MRKLILLVLLIGFSVAIGLNWDKFAFDISKVRSVSQLKQKREILRFALVADSHSENELLAKALEQAKGEGINFVIGLGDWTTIGILDELDVAKKVFDNSGLKYYLTAGDHDLWDSRNRGENATTNFTQIFGSPSHHFDIENVRFVVLDNSDIYKGIDDSQWRLLKETKVSQVSRVSKVSKTSGTSDTFDTFGTSKLTFVFAHKTPFHPESKHIMGENSQSVADQAQKLITLLEQTKVDGFFSGDIHFFAQYKSPSDIVKITTVGAVSRQRNFQGPRFAVVTVWDDYSWDVEDVEIRFSGSREMTN